MASTFRFEVLLVLKMGELGSVGLTDFFTYFTLMLQYELFQCSRVGSGCGLFPVEFAHRTLYWLCDRIRFSGYRVAVNLVAVDIICISTFWLVYHLVLLLLASTLSF